MTFLLNLKKCSICSLLLFSITVSASIEKTQIRTAIQKNESEQNRYFAILNLAQKKDTALEKEIPQLIRDSSWLVRTATVKASGYYLKNKNIRTLVIKTSKSDPALVVRKEAQRLLEKKQ